MCCNILLTAINNNILYINLLNYNPGENQEYALRKKQLYKSEYQLTDQRLNSN